MSNRFSKQLQAILCSVVAEQINLSPDDNLFELGILDSVLLIQLVAQIEEKFGVSVADREISPDNFLSIERMSLYLAQKMASVHAT